jgi:hypothetical protein
MANDDGALNFWFDNVYTLSQSGGAAIATIDVGFTHATSGDELIRVFTGFLKTVKYNKGKCTALLKDKLWGLSERVAGDSTNPVSMSAIPSDIAWTLCTCYGGLDSTASTSNADIDYTSFQEWAAVLSADAITCDVYYDGTKVRKALTALAEYNDSANWVEGDGKIYFERFAEATSLDTLLSEQEQIELKIDIDDKRLINKQDVYGNYDITSRDWFLNVSDVASASVNSYGIREDVLKNKMVWFTSSINALNIAARRTTLFAEPPKAFDIQTAGVGLEMQISETVRMVDSFMSITSEDAWRIVGLKFNVNDFMLNLELDGATTLDPFYLDVDFLDGPKALL